MKRLPVPVLLFDEPELLKCIAKRFLGGRPSNDVRLSEQFSPEQVREVRKLLTDHFFDHGRYNQAAAIFSALAQLDALFVVPLVTALRKIDAVDDANAIIAKALAEHPTLVELRLIQSEMALDAGQLQIALEYSRAAVQMDTKCCDGWFKLVTVYLAARNYDLALIALNVVPMQPEPPAPKIPKTAAGRTEPKMRLRAEASEDQWSDGEDEMQPSGLKPELDTVGELPGAGLKGGRARVSGKPGAGYELEAYEVLVSLYLALGWDQLLAVRSQVLAEPDAAGWRVQVFLMQEDIVPAGEGSDIEAAQPDPGEPANTMGSGDELRDSLRGGERMVGSGSGNGMAPDDAGDASEPAELPAVASGVQLAQIPEFADQLSASDLALMEELTDEAALEAAAAIMQQAQADNDQVEEPTPLEPEPAAPALEGDSQKKKATKKAKKKAKKKNASSSPPAPHPPPEAELEPEPEPAELAPDPEPAELEPDSEPEPEPAELEPEPEPEPESAELELETGTEGTNEGGTIIEGQIDDTDDGKEIVANLDPTLMQHTAFADDPMESRTRTSTFADELEQQAFADDPMESRTRTSTFADELEQQWEQSEDAELEGPPTSTALDAMKSDADDFIDALQACVELTQDNDQDEQADSVASQYAHLSVADVRALSAIWRHLSGMISGTGVTVDAIEAAFCHGDHSLQDDPGFFADSRAAAEQFIEHMDADKNGEIECSEFLRLYDQMAEDGHKMDTTVAALRLSCGMASADPSDDRPNSAKSETDQDACSDTVAELRPRTSTFADRLERQWAQADQSQSGFESSFALRLREGVDRNEAGYESSFSLRLREGDEAVDPTSVESQVDELDEITDVDNIDSIASPLYIEEVNSGLDQMPEESEADLVQAEVAPAEPGPAPLYIEEANSEPAPDAESADVHLETKRLCSGWMDRLFRALYTDVRAFAQWMIEDEQAKEIGHVHGKQRTRGDWLKLGMLAERLQQLQEAETAYRCCVRVRFDPLVWKKLMDLYVRARYVSEPLVCATQLCNYHLLRLGEYFEPKKELPPPEVQKMMCGLVAVHGMTQVKSALKHAVASGGCPQIMQNMMEFIVRHECHGYLGNV